jgi:hypothetical protein
MVFPLYNEEVHVRQKDIADFDSLKGSGCGREDGSGTISPPGCCSSLRCQTQGNGDDRNECALSRLKANQIDAMFYVAGYPVKLFNEGVMGNDGLALIPIANKAVAEFYQQTRIPKGTYPWQPADVSTVAVKAVWFCDFRNSTANQAVFSDPHENMGYWRTGTPNGNPSTLISN